MEACLRVPRFYSITSWLVSLERVFPVGFNAYITVQPFRLFRYLDEEAFRFKFEEHGCTLRALNDPGDESPEGELTDCTLSPRPSPPIVPGEAFAPDELREACRTAGARARGAPTTPERPGFAPPPRCSPSGRAWIFRPG